MSPTTLFGGVLTSVCLPKVEVRLFGSVFDDPNDVWPTDIFEVNQFFGQRSTEDLCLKQSSQVFGHRLKIVHVSIRRNFSIKSVVKPMAL